MDSVNQYNADKMSWHPLGLNQDDVASCEPDNSHNQAHRPSSENFFAGSAIKPQSSTSFWAKKSGVFVTGS